MSTVLIYTSPARGHLYPVMDIAVALRSAGHRVVVQTLSDERAHVVAEGLEHRPIAPRIESLPLDDHTARTPIGQLRHTVDCWSARAPLEIEDLREAISDVSPDLVVVDANSWGAAASAEAGGGPWAMFLPYCLPVASPDTPAFGPGFAPPRHALDRARDRLLWWLQEAATRSAVETLNVLRQDVGVPRVGKVAEIYQRADLLLYRTAEPFEYPRRTWPGNVRMIGPGLWSPPATAPDWLAELPHPRILVSVSTEYQDDGAIIEAALGAFGAGPGSVIVTTAALDPQPFRDMVGERPDIRVLRSLPHAEVIPAVDVVVTHGGMGTVQRALAAGVPVCVVPWGRDQKESARRAHQCGAGTIVTRGRLSPATLRDAVADAMGRRPQAQRVAEGFSRAGGAAEAVTLLEKLLADSPLPDRPAPGRR